MVVSWNVFLFYQSHWLFSKILLLAFGKDSTGVEMCDHCQPFFALFHFITLKKTLLVQFDFSVQVISQTKFDVSQQSWMNHWKPIKIHSTAIPNGKSVLKNAFQNRLTPYQALHPLNGFRQKVFHILTLMWSAQSTRFAQRSSYPKPFGEFKSETTRKKVLGLQHWQMLEGDKCHSRMTWLVFSV